MESNKANQPCTQCIWWAENGDGAQRVCELCTDYDSFGLKDPSEWANDISRETNNNNIIYPVKNGDVEYNMLQNKNKQYQYPKHFHALIESFDARTQHGILGFVTKANKINPDRRTFHRQQDSTTRTISWLAAERYEYKPRNNIFEDD